MKLSKLADSLLNTHHNLALIRQDPGTEHFEVAEKILQSNAQAICHQLPTTDELVEMARTSVRRLYMSSYSPNAKSKR